MTLQGTVMDGGGGGLCCTKQDLGPHSIGSLSQAIHQETSEPIVVHDTQAYWYMSTRFQMQQAKVVITAESSRRERARRQDQSAGFRSPGMLFGMLTVVALTSLEWLDKNTLGLDGICNARKYTRNKDKGKVLSAGIQARFDSTSVDIPDNILWDVDGAKTKTLDEDY
ncbi:hypothetical protein Tco_1505645 [Tanacetum coccineum]